MAGSGIPRHGLTPNGDGAPDLAAEARFWRDWNTAAFDCAGHNHGAGHTSEEAAALAARNTPDPDRLASVRGHAEAAAAILTRPEAAVDPGLIEIHAAAGRFFHACLPGSWVPDYLADRGLSAALLTTSPWKIGYAPATWTALLDHLRRQGWDDATMLCAGLVTRGRDGRLHDRFRDRLMIPLRDEHGYAVAFIGRRHPEAGDDKGPKYLNSPDTTIFTKGNVLAGLAEGRRALAHGAQPVLVEGPMDAIAVSVAAPGRFAGISPCGTALSPHQVAVLSRKADLAAVGVRVALDGDAAGQQAALRAYPLLQPATADITAVILPGSQDPADILKTDGPDALRKMLTSSVCPLADLVIDSKIEQWARGRDNLDTEQQIGALRAAAATLVAMPPAEASRQAGRLAALFIRRYDWPPDLVSAEFITAIEQHYETSLVAANPASRATMSPTGRHESARGPRLLSSRRRGMERH
jgi:DNA primase